MKKVAAKSYPLRIDAQLVKPLQELKKHNRRSLNAEINAALENWIAHSRPTTVPAPTPEAAPLDTGKRAKGKAKERAQTADASAAVAVPQEVEG